MNKDLNEDTDLENTQGFLINHDESPKGDINAFMNQEKKSEIDLNENQNEFIQLHFPQEIPKNVPV